jgi:choline dehydrogenase-like flavoprotein
MTPLSAQTTAFTKDVFGRYVCNGLDEALRTTDKSIRPDAKEFDIIVIGGGTFGAAIAQHLFYQDQSRNHRILVLEGGPFLLPSHVQNIPMMGINSPSPTSIADLRNSGQAITPRNEVWGLAWHSPVKFPGLAYCIGGRSVFWGGWSPRLLDAEMPLAKWPANVVNDLKKKDGYFDQSSEQIGVTQTNDFINGDMHVAMRQQLFDGIQNGNIPGAVPLNELELHLDNIPLAEREINKLEAPLAVETQARSGFFPDNKFSSVPLLIKASRDAYNESKVDDFKKRLMIVPLCHVTKLVTQISTGPSKASGNGQPLNLAAGQVVGIETNQGTIAVPANGKVIIALATVESTRLALNSFQGIPNYNLIGQNLMAHLRSNYTIRIPRTSLKNLANTVKDLQASALFVKGRVQHADGTVSHYHHQITAAGLGATGTDSEAELFKVVPDIDGLEALKAANDTSVVITIRGIGEMESMNPQSFVRLDTEADEFGTQRAFVNITASPKDMETWNAMDKTAEDIANVFADGKPFEVLGNGNVRDGLGSTHHEVGTLWMGDDPNSSVTDSMARFHYVENSYVAAPALFPSTGSPNPMLTGIALIRRMADHIIPKPIPFSISTPKTNVLFDDIHLSDWKMVGAGDFILNDGALESVPGNDLGLMWYTKPLPKDFQLSLEWKRYRDDDNSGVFLRFPDPEKRGYNNPAYVAVDLGYEVQIDENGAPDGAPIHKTGAIYGQVGQNEHAISAKPVGEWNLFEIEVKDENYKVNLNGQLVTSFVNTNPNRGLISTINSPSFVGLQSYPGKRVAFRNIYVKEL